MRDLVLLVVAAATIGSVRGQAAEGAEEAHAMEEEHHRSLSVAAMALCAAFVRRPASRTCWSGLRSRV